MPRPPNIPKRKLLNPVKLAPQQNQATLLTMQGLALHQQGKLYEAQAIYQQVLAIQADHFDALQLLGALSVQTTQFTKAVDFLTRALQVNPDHAACYSNRGNALNELKRFDEALESCDRAIRIKPDFADAYSNRGNALSELKRLDEAIESYDRAIRIKPDFANAYSNRGTVLKELKRFDEALESCDSAIRIKPDFTDAYSNRGNILIALKRFDEALESYDRAICIKPDFADAYSNRSIVLIELKRFDEALESCDSAIRIKPDYADAYSNRGIALTELKRFDEALESCDSAIRIKPDYADAYSNRGNIFIDLKRFDEALESYDSAIRIKPDYADAYSNRGTVLIQLKLYDEAIAHYDKALSLKADMEWIFGDWLHTKMKICSWSDVLESLDSISKKVMQGKKVTHPFPLLALNDIQLLNMKCSKNFIQNKYPFNPLLGPIPRRSKRQKIKIGYFSADFKNHPVAFLIAELFEIHDRSKFEIYAFSLSGDSDEMRGRLVKAFDHFINVETQSDIQIAKLARDFGIDIAVDLTGLTKDSRTGIFSYRAAPIQVNYLGYPGTMGADYIDYIIADKTLIPLDAQSSYSEKVVYLPNSYQVNDRKRAIAEKQFTRHELGLPEDGFVFCCFNNNFKILPATFTSWMRILKAVEGSVLWLFQDNHLATENLKKEAQKQGVDVQRLVFADRLPVSEHLARHRQADLFLDTLPYNAHTTTSDALWSGLPVLTLMGQSFASRVAASLLNAIGLPELITNTREEYETLAVGLAQNPRKLAEIKLKLTNNRLITPLFDTPLFTKNLETAYIKMYERYQADMPLAHIFVD